MQSFLLGAILISNALSQHKESCESINHEMARFIIPDESLSDFKDTHDMVLKAIYSIEPKDRQPHKAHKITTTSLKTIDGGVDIVMDSVALQLGMKLEELDPTLTLLLKGKVKSAELGLEVDMDRYATYKLSWDWGGKSQMMVAVVGYKKTGDDEFQIGASVYREEWEEQPHVRLKKCKDIPISDCPWADANVEKFLYYAMYQNLLPSSGHS